MDFCVIRSPVGLLRLEEAEGFLVRLDRTDMPPRGPETPLLAECTRQLQAYFDGALTVFDLPLNPQGTPFRRKV